MRAERDVRDVAHPREGLVARYGLRLPAVGLDRARWFYWAFACVAAAWCVPAIVGRPTGGPLLQAAGLAGVVVLVLMRTCELRRGRLLPVWNELPQAVALGAAASASGPLTAGVGLFFTTCFFLAVYASTVRTLLSTFASVGLLAACASAVDQAWHQMFFTQGLGIVPATLLTRVLVAALTRQNDVVLASERLLTTVFDNLDDAVTVTSDAHAPALMNRAARELNLALGLPAGPVQWSDHLAVFAADGQTPLPREQLPAVLALTGERIQDRSVVVGMPDGSQRYFSVNAAQVADEQARARAVVTVREVTAARHAQVELAHLATHDVLTGLVNRAELVAAIDRARQTGSAASVLLLDLDGFKRVNDSLGHAFGDEVLQTIAGRLRAAVRPDDVVARLGGDEFAVLAAADNDPGALARRVCEMIGEPVVLSRASVSLSASVGVAPATTGPDADAVLAAADLAMYAAKADGPGQVQQFHADLRHALDQRLDLEAELLHALEQGGFELHYQPYVNLETGQVTGTEALVRWRHPTRGLIPPLAFIPLIEDNRMVVPLGRWILHTACQVGAAWQPADPAQLRTMSVNVSARQLEDRDIVADVTAALAGSGLPAHALTLEITESALVDDAPLILDRLHALKALGVKIALDDFGTGYSSLSRLATFPVDTLKIDRSFVGRVETETGNALVRAILALAGALELDVVAEGVETPGQAAALTALGCRVAQGYLFGRPTLASALTPVITAPVMTTEPDRYHPHQQRPARQP